MKLRMTTLSGRRTNGFYHIFEGENALSVPAPIKVEKRKVGLDSSRVLQNVHLFLCAYYYNLKTDQVGLVQSNIQINEYIFPEELEAVAVFCEEIHINGFCAKLNYGLTVQRKIIDIRVDWGGLTDSALQKLILDQSKYRATLARALFDQIQEALFKEITDAHNQCAIGINGLINQDEETQGADCLAKIKASIQRHNTFSICKKIDDVQVFSSPGVPESCQVLSEPQSTAKARKRKKGTRGRKKHHHVATAAIEAVSGEQLLSQKVQEILDIHEMHAKALHAIRLDNQIILGEMYSARTKKHPAPFNYTYRATQVDAVYVLRRVIDFGARQTIALHHKIEGLLQESFCMPKDAVSEQVKDIQNSLLFLHRYVGAMLDYLLLNAIAQCVRKDMHELLPYITNRGYSLFVHFIIYQYNARNISLVLECVDLLCQEHDLFPMSLVNTINIDPKTIFEQIIVDYRNHCRSEARQEQQASLVMFKVLSQFYSKSMEGLLSSDGCLTIFPIWLQITSAQMFPECQESPFVEAFLETGGRIDHTCSMPIINKAIGDNLKIGIMGIQSLSFYCIASQSDGALFERLVEGSSITSLWVALACIWVQGALPYMLMKDNRSHGKERQTIQLVEASGQEMEHSIPDPLVTDLVTAIELYIDPGKIQRAQRILAVLYAKTERGIEGGENSIQCQLSFMLKRMPKNNSVQFKILNTAFYLSLFMKRTDQSISSYFSCRVNKVKIVMSSIQAHALNQQIGRNFGCDESVQRTLNSIDPRLGSQQILSRETLDKKLKCFAHFSRHLKQLFSKGGAFFESATRLCIAQGDWEYFVGLLLSETSKPCWESVFRIVAETENIEACLRLFKCKAVAAHALPHSCPDKPAIVEKMNPAQSLKRLAASALWRLVLNVNQRREVLKWDHNITSLMKRIYGNHYNRLLLSEAVVAVQCVKDIFSGPLMEMERNQQVETGRALSDVVLGLRGIKPDKTSYGTMLWELGSVLSSAPTDTATN